ncbi:MAG: hypothetical protein Ct9H300mP9_6640 [Candidatus Neomarinimicrobiota bacterium]|nr:MAG: hypothetical protein Ct9H300mP9_6640 [Candidatus Neomarinimicrobiota bacterium]
MTILWIFVVHWYTSLFFPTFFLHRYYHTVCSRCQGQRRGNFFVFTFFSKGASFLNPRAYGILHRLHHAHSDTIKDPHSPAQTGNIIRMNFVTFSRYWSILKGDAYHGEYENGIPKWERFEKFTNKFLVRALFIGLYVGLYATFAPLLGNIFFCQYIFSWDLYMAALSIGLVIKLVTGTTIPSRIIQRTPYP